MFCIIYTMEQGENIVSETEIRFFTPRFYAFDSFSAYTVEIWGKKFLTSEHAYQWKKYSDSAPELASQILDAQNPNAVKKISDSNKDKAPLAWNTHKVSVMEEILRAKIKQHEKVRSLLKESGNKIIKENSPTDSFWGVGPDDNGENQLGKLWMKLRAELK